MVHSVGMPADALATWRSTSSFSWASEVVYPEGLNGGFGTTAGSPSQTVNWDSESTSEPAILQVNLPRTTPGDKPIIALPWSSTPISTPHSATEYPSYIATCPSMVEEIEGILSSAMLDTLQQSSVCISPRRPAPMAPNTPVASKGEVPSGSGERVLVYPKQLPPSPHGSSQVGTANVMAHSSPSPSPISGTPEGNSSPFPLQLQANSITLPDDVLHLQEVMNDATVHLLTLKASVDAHWQKLTSETEITHHQNESKTSKAIKEIKACYAAALSGAKATYVAAIREAEATHSAFAREAEVIHTTAVRKVEAASVVQTFKLQQDHQETMQTLEDEAIKEEKHACQSFLQVCGVALQACPNEALGVLMYPIHLVTGNMSLTDLLMVAPQLTISLKDPIPSPSPPQEACHYYTVYWDQVSTFAWTGGGIRPFWRQGTYILPRVAAPMKVEGVGSSGRALEGCPPGSLPQGLRPDKMHKANLYLVLIGWSSIGKLPMT